MNTLTHYFRIVFQHLGLKWTADNEGELDWIEDELSSLREEIIELRAQVDALRGRF